MVKRRLAEKLADGEDDVTSSMSKRTRRITALRGNSESEDDGVATLQGSHPPDASHREFACTTDEEADVEQREGEDESLNEAQIAHSHAEECDIAMSGRSNENDDEDADDPEDFDEITVEERARVREKGHASAGVLASVKLFRFMSHESFEYPLGRNVNIVNGPNGSGKSAIVAAVQIGLGARASATERAASLADHIMHGKENAVVQIRIHNSIDKEGDTSYKHDIYGDYINIERTLVRGGNGRWKVSGQKRGIKLDAGVTERREVMNICDHFGFMVENPVAVLTQTKIKAFLQQCKPAQHYQLFREATLLGPLAAELDKAFAAHAQIMLILKQKSALGPEVQKQLADLKAAYEESKEMKTLGSRIEAMETVFAWACASQEEKKLVEYETETKDNFEVALEKTMNREVTLRQNIEVADKEMQVAEASLKDITSAISEAKRDHRNALKTWQTRKNEHDRELKNISSLQVELSAKENARKGAICRRDEARNSHMNGQGQIAHIVDSLRNLDGQLASAAEEQKLAEEAHGRVDDELRSASEDRPRLQRNVDHLRRTYEDKRREAAYARQHADQANHVGRFGRSLPNAMRAVEQYIRAGKFQHPPIGPLGQYISVKDDDWACTVQEVIGDGMLGSFLVADAQDLAVLQSAFAEARAGRPRAILVGRYGMNRTRYNIDPKYVPSVQHLGHHTVLEMLEINQDAVFNALVDHCRIEGNVLVRGEDAMVELSREPDLTVRMCWDEAGNRAYTRNRGHTFRATTRDPRTRGSRLTANREAYVCELEDACTAISNERAKAEQELSQHGRFVEQMSRKNHDAGRAATAARKGHELLLRKKAELEDQMNAATMEFESAPYDEDIRSYESDISDIAAQVKAAEESVAELGESCQKLKNDEHSAKLRFESMGSEVKSKSDSLGNVGRTLAKDKAELRRVLVERAKQEEIVRKAHEEIAVQRARFVKVLADARMLSSEQPELSEKSPDQIHLEIEGMKRRLEREQNRNGGKSADEIEEEYLLAAKKDIENQAMLKRIKRYALSIKKGLEIRKTERSKMEDRTKRIVRQNFNLFLQSRGHRGKISFKRNDKGVSELIITTQMATHRTGDGDLHVTKDLRALSGGERSYTTLAFMLALAEVCQNPVRIMDEPDVFMDDVSRDVAFRELVEFCSTQLSDRQMILVTPLRLPAGLHSTNSVRIQKLQKPLTRREHDRGNQTIMDTYVT
jgi:structural maintenance of chromosomes protein 6